MIDIKLPGSGNHVKKVMKDNPPPQPTPPTPTEEVKPAVEAKPAVVSTGGLNLTIKVGDGGQGFKAKAPKNTYSMYPNKIEEKVFPPIDERFCEDAKIQILFEQFNALLNGKKGGSSYHEIFKLLFEALDREDAPTILSENAVRIFYQGATTYANVGAAATTEVDASVLKKMQADAALNADLASQGLEGLL